MTATATTAPPRKTSQAETDGQSADASKLGFNKLSFPQNLIAALLMAFIMHTDNPADDAGEDADPKKNAVNQTFAGLLGFKKETEFKQWRQEMRDTGWQDWKKLTDFSKTNFDKAKEFVKNPPKSLLDLVARHESGGDYNIVFGGKRADLTNMTIDQVLDMQHRSTHEDHAKSSAAGKYQMLEGTLRGLKNELHMSGTEKFDQHMQDQLAVVLMQRRGLNDFMDGRLSEDKFMSNLSKEWASLPKDTSGRGSYDGDGLNKAFAPAAAQEHKILAEVRANGNVGLHAPSSQPALANA